MTNIIAVIEKSIYKATGLKMYYDTTQTLNIKLDYAQYPCAIMAIVESGLVENQNGILRERLTINVGFTGLSKLDFDGMTVEQEELMKLKEYACKWILSLYRSKELRLRSINNTFRWYATEDQIRSVYGVNITVEDAVGVSACDFDE